MDIFHWNWVGLCGPGGLVPWYPSKSDVGTCFQQIFLQIPVLMLFGIVSSYYYGRTTERRVTHTRQKWTIRLRLIISLTISIVPVARTIAGMEYAYGIFRPVSYLTAGVEIIAWLVHAGYVHSLRHQVNCHGPVFLRVLWTLTAVLSVISLRTYILDSSASHEIAYKVQFGFALSLVVLQILYGFTFLPIPQPLNPSSTDRHTQFSERSSLVSSFYQGFREDLDPEYLGTAMEESTFTSRLLFYWVNKLMKKGTEGKLRSIDDLYDLPTKFNTSYLCVKLHTALNENDHFESQSCYGATEDVSNSPGTKYTSLLRALHRCFGVQFYAIGLLKLLADLLGFGGPMLLNLLVNFIEDKSESMTTGYIIATGFFLTTFFGAFLTAHFNFFIAEVGLQLRGALISTIYRKTLNLSSLSISKFSMGEIVNFMSTDTDRIVNSCPSFHAFWSIPIQLAITFYLLYLQVGLAFLAGVAFTIILIPINKLIASKIGQISTKLMEEKDQRVGSMAEILRGIRVLKIHVWEEHFLQKVLNIRQRELKQLKGRKYLDALCVYFWATTPVIISILTFATYSFMGNELTAAKVFTTMALLNMLISPLNAFPWVLNGLTEAWVSVKRIQKFLDLKDCVINDYFNSIPIEKKEVYSFKECSFIWNQPNHEENETYTPNQETEVSRSSTSSTIDVQIKDRKGKRLVKKNAKMSEIPDVEDTKRTIQSPRSFMLKNINISINEGYLVGVIGPVGSGKTTLLTALLGEVKKINGEISMKNIEGGCALVTQTPWLQRGTLRENVIFGKSFDGIRYKEVLEACSLTQDIENLHGGDTARIGEGGMTLSGGQRARVAIARAVYQNKDIYLLDDILSSVDVHVARHIYNKVVCGLLKEKTRILCTNQIELLSNANLIIQMDKGSIVRTGKPSEILPEIEDSYRFDSESLSSINAESKLEGIENVVEDEEISETGAVSFNVYQRYWTSMGYFLAFMVLVSVTLMQASRNFTDYWLSEWVSQDSKSNNTTAFFFHDVYKRDTTKYYLTVYVLLAVMNTFFTFFRAFLFAYGGVNAARKIHEKLLKRVVYSNVAFFDISPIGRILNRFSSDSYTVDDSLPFILNILLAQFFGLLGSLVITIYGLPWLCLLIAPLVPIYFYIQNTYRHSSRELKRLSSVSLSPVYNHFNETLQGLTTIRAFRSLLRFKRTHEDYLESNQKAQFASQSANQWLSLRLQMIGVAMVTGVASIAVLQHEFDVIDPALIGLTIAYALSLTNLLNGVVSAFVETEKELISLERIGQYTDEIAPETEAGNHPPYAWPSQGVITFQGVYLKYRVHLTPSLNGVSFETRPAEKIGVVGRTGAGKSSLIVALLRLVNVSSGNILIDRVNVNYIYLQALRSRLAVIPQDPFLFEGTIRENVDPLGEYKDLEIGTALAKCHLTEFVQRFGGLDGKVLAGGRNFSQGQKQLLCLVRAVLRNAKIVCVDEGTASVDSETDKQIQITVRSCFRQSTVLTIAHRISTIMDNDRVLVLEDGEVIEFDSPTTLASDKSSYFYKLCQQEIQ